MIKILIDDWFKDHFQSGDTIQGRVQCSVLEADFVDVQVELLGEECTFGLVERWKNNFLESESLVLHSGDINFGDYEFPFNLTLPSQMAGSYLGEHGHVKFFIIARMIRNNTKLCEDRTEVNVFSPVNLNYQAHTRMAPSNHFDQLTFQKWWCIHEFAEMEVRLEKNAFVLGEVMKIKVDVHNNSSLSVSSVNAKLLLRIQAKVSSSTGGVLDTFHCLAVCQQKCFLNYGMKTYYIDMKIPENIELPNFKGCNLISLKAFLEVTTVLNTSSMLKVEVFVVLGHIPHIYQKSQFTSAQETENRLHSGITSSLTGGLYDRPKSMPSLRSDEKTSSLLTSPLVPPYPAAQHFNVSLPDVPTYPPVLSRNPREGMQTPLSLYKEHKIAPYPTQMPLLPTAYDKPNPPYPTESSCPYPTEKSKFAAPYPMETFNKSAPYPVSPNPRNLEEREEDVLLPITMPMPIGFNEGPPYRSNVGSDEDLITKMPSLPLFAEVDAHPPYPLSTSEVNPPYPIEQRTIFKTAPYPLENPPYPTESFLGITAMPMPSKGSPVPCDTIGFAVPASVASDIHLPSAPPLSEIQTPPIAKVEELNYPLDMHFADAFSDDASDVEYSSLPELPSPPTEEVEERSAEGTAASSEATFSYEETTSPTEVKKKRTKKEKALAV